MEEFIEFFVVGKKNKLTSHFVIDQVVGEIYCVKRNKRDKNLIIEISPYQSINENLSILIKLTILDLKKLIYSINNEIIEFLSANEDFYPNIKDQLLAMIGDIMEKTDNGTQQIEKKFKKFASTVDKFESIQIKLKEKDTLIVNNNKISVDNFYNKFCKFIDNLNELVVRLLKDLIKTYALYEEQMLEPEKIIKIRCSFIENADLIEKNIREKIKEVKTLIRKRLSYFGE